MSRAEQAAQLIFAAGESALIEMQTLPFYSRSPSLIVMEIIKTQQAHAAQPHETVIRIQSSESEATFDFVMRRSLIEVHYLFETDSYDHRWFELQVMFLFIQVLNEASFVNTQLLIYAPSAVIFSWYLSV